MKPVKTICIICLAVLLIMAGCSRKPRSVDNPIIIPEETTAPVIEEGFENITDRDSEQALEPRETEDPQKTEKPQKTGVVLLSPVSGDSGGNDEPYTPPAPALVVGDTEYNENQTERMRQMAVEYSQKMGLQPPYCETYVESFRTAKWPTSADYSNVSADIPTWLYEEPVNRFAATETEAEGSGYLNNVECLKKLGDSASAIVDIGKRHAEIYAFFDYMADTKDTIYSRLSTVFPSDHDISQDAEDLYGSIVAKELTVEGFVVTDATMLYRDADGLYRLRCSVFKQILHASAATYEEMQCAQGEWREVDIEVVIGISDGSILPMYQNVVSPYYNVDPSMTEYIDVIRANGYSY